MGKRKWRYRTYRNEQGERWAFIEENYSEFIRPINIWCISPKENLLYTFEPNEVYNKDSKWNETFIKQFMAELKSPVPSVKVLRYVYNGRIIFAEDGYTKKIPAAPKAPKRPGGWEKHLEKVEKEQIRKKEQKEGCVPAPYILFGRHDKDEKFEYANGDKEYYWNLTPDIEERQGIQVGDRVVVWTVGGFSEVTVTRIEESTGDILPTARVIKKL